MTYCLAPGIYACKPDGRSILLDLATGRYFCLPRALESCFTAVVAGRGEEGDASALDALRDMGVVTLGSADGRRESPPGGPACRSLLDRPAGPIDARNKVRALHELAVSAVMLRLWPVERIFNAFTRRKSSLSRQDELPCDALAFADAFRWSGQYSGTHEHCLWRSLGLARGLAARGNPVDLILGVRTGPFHAHSWVEYGGMLLNEHLETARAYTPILRF